MTREEEREAIKIIVNDFEEAGDDAMDDDETIVEKLVDVNTQKIERTWREVKRDLTNQHINVLRRNVGVAMFRYNHLNVNIPFAERRIIVIGTLAKHQFRVAELLRPNYPVYDEDEVIKVIVSKGIVFDNFS